MRTPLKIIPVIPVAYTNSVLNVLVIPLVKGRARNVTKAIAYNSRHLSSYLLFNEHFSYLLSEVPRSLTEFFCVICLNYGIYARKSICPTAFART